MSGPFLEEMVPVRTKMGPARPAVVLVASKQEWTSRSLESILAPSGYVVLASYTARGTLLRAKRDQPDAIIVDAHLPDGSGHDLCHRLRSEMLVTPSTPILVTLPKPPTRSDRLAALGAGAWVCLSEPLDAEETLAILDALVPAKLDADHARSKGLVDEATGLYNVRGLTRRAKELASHAARTRAPLACVVLASKPSPDDPERALGETPSAVLSQIAGSLTSTGRRSDVIGRLGLDAFAVVALDTNAGQARQLANRLCGGILAPADASAPAHSAFRLHAGCYGVPDFRAASIDAVELMFRATAALRQAQTDPAGGWLRDFADSDTGPRLA
jgi:diguanylate cyclase (GGDEF)-like protein